MKLQQDVAAPGVGADGHPSQQGLADHYNSHVFSRQNQDKGLLRHAVRTWAVIPGTRPRNSAASTTPVLGSMVQKGLISKDIP
ncbi:hypothetical protein [Thiomonas sp. FB-6]|uniref:hypothetical protein n=1 Tax=Thiomonas sp. FB-6 TaxID=1158291 RepID=UPI0012DCCBD7|nr:hypothetical protein [Thiomonas sp. FB-6]